MEEPSALRRHVELKNTQLEESLVAYEQVERG